MNRKALLAKLSENLGSPAVSEVSPVIDSAIAPPELPVKPLQPTKKKESRNKITRKQVTEPPAVAPSASVSGSGKQAAFWLDDEDRAILQEMGMLLYSQGIKPSHNLVIRAALRMMPKDHRFFEKAQELLQKDGRKLRHVKGD